MKYEDLLNNLHKNKDFSIYDSKYSQNFFGDFHIKLYYKNKIKLRILNDRDIIEILLIYHSFLSRNTVPLEFAVDFLNNCTNKNKVYTFSNISDAYLFLENSKAHLDEIAEKDLLKNISKAYNSIKECFEPTEKE